MAHPDYLTKENCENYLAYLRAKDLANIIMSQLEWMIYTLPINIHNCSEFFFNEINSIDKINTIFKHLKLKKITHNDSTISFEAYLKDLGISLGKLENLAKHLQTSLPH